MARRRRRKQRQKERQLGFGASLERYFYKRIAEAHVKWEWVGIGIAAMVIGGSIAAGYFRSSTLFGGTREVIRMAAESGDYELARELMVQMQRDKSSDHLPTSAQGSELSVLGVSTELEELVYPEKKLEREIEKAKELLKKYPGSRDVLVSLSKLYREVGKMEEAKEYWERARVLDPNNEMFEEQ